MTPAMASGAGSAAEHGLPSRAAGRLAAPEASLAPVLRCAIEALVRCDPRELERLLRLAGSLAALPAAAELAEAQSLHRLLGALLNQTRRNLRLLRRASQAPSAQAYGSNTF